MSKKLKINTWTAILNIVNCVLFTISWFVIFGTAFTDALGSTANATSGAATFFYVMAWIGVVLNERSCNVLLCHGLDWGCFKCNLHLPITQVWH